MHLFRYLDEHVVDTIRDRQLKVSKPTDFNDPFELSYQAKSELTREEAERILTNRQAKPEFWQRAREHPSAPNTDEGLKDHFARNRERIVTGYMQKHADLVQWGIQDLKRAGDEFTRLLCMSGDIDDPGVEILIWSHYTNGHKGARIELNPSLLEGSQRELKKMRYQTKRPFVDVTLDGESKEHFDQMTNALDVKSSAWKYENESRLVLFPHECAPGATPDTKDLDFIPLPPGALVSIDFGIRMPPESRSQILDLLAHADFSHVVKREAVFHPSEYKLEYCEIDS